MKYFRVKIKDTDLSRGSYEDEVKPGAIFWVSKELSEPARELIYTYLPDRYYFKEATPNIWLLKEHCEVIPDKAKIGGELICVK